MSTFEARIDEILALAAPHFRRLDLEAREEALQNTLGLAWKAWVRLVQQGKAGDEGVFRSMVWFAVKQTRVGRMPQGRARAKDVLDYARRGKAGVTVEEVNL